MTTSTPAPNDSTAADRSTAQTEVLPDGLTQTAVLPDPAPQTQQTQAQAQPQPQAQAPTEPAAEAPAAAPAASSATPAQAVYGYPANGAPFVYLPPRPTNVLGIITLVLGILGFALVPVITGHIALAQIKRTGDEGRGITIAGLVLGYIGLAGYVLVGLFFFFMLFLSFTVGIGLY